ncbi:MAG: hypothetical protein QM831_25995 [Kofleriaceae bacterium]
MKRGAVTVAIVLMVGAVVAWKLFWKHDPAAQHLEHDRANGSSAPTPLPGLAGSGSSASLPRGNSNPVPGAGPEVTPFGAPGSLAIVPDHYELTSQPGSQFVNRAGGKSTLFTHDPKVESWSRRIAVHVKDDAGNAVAGAVILLSKEKLHVFAGSLSGEAGGTSDARGDASIAAPDDAMSAIAIHAKGWSDVVDVKPGDPSVELVVHPMGTLTGTASFNNHAESFQLHLKSTETPLDIVYETNADGTFTIAMLRPGTWTIEYGLAQAIAGGSSHTEQKTVTIEAGKTTTVKLEQTSATLVVVHTKTDDVSMVQYWLFDGAVAPANKDEAKASHPTGGMLFGGIDAKKDMQFHDVAAGKHTICLNKTYKDEHLAFGCTQVTLMPGDETKEITLEP